MSCCLSRVSATSLYRSSASLVCLIRQSTQPFHHSSFHPVELAPPSHLTLRSIHPAEPSFLDLVFNSTLLLNLPCLDHLDPSSVDKEPLSIRCCAARSERFWTIFMIPSLHPWNARNRYCKVSLFLMNAWRYSFLSTVIIKITISSIVIGLKNSCFPLIHLPSCYRTVCYRTVRWANQIQSCSLNQPVTTLVSITIKTVHRLLNWGFLQNGEFFPINYDNILEDFVWKLSIFGLIGNKTSRRPTRFVIILRPY